MMRDHPSALPSADPAARPLRWLDPLLGSALAGALAMLLTTALPGQARAADRVIGNGQAANEQRQVARFDSVQTDGPTVLVRQGPVASITVQADSNLLPLLETVVDGQRLLVRWQRGSSIRTSVKPMVTVTAVMLAGLVVSGSGDLTGEALRSPALAVRVDGSGDLRLNDLVADELTVSVRGSGDVAASGSATRLAVSIAGSGDVKTRGLKADVVSVRIAGSGDADVQARRTLDVAIAGSGDVVYSGAATVKKTIAGSGSVTQH